MAFDTSIYQSLKPMQMPDLADTAQKVGALNLQQMQQQKAQREQAQQARIETGKALELVAGLPDDQRPAAYQEARAQLIQDGHIDAAHAPEQYDQNFVAHGLAQWRQSKEYNDLQETKAKTENYLAEAAKNRRENRNPAKELTPGQKAADEVAGKDIAEYYYGGGKATAEKNIARFQGAIEKLKSNPDLTGGVTTRLPLLSSDMAQDSLNPELAQVRDDIRGAVQGTLRQVLGSQFTEKEGEAIFNRSFNPRLSATENVRRAEAELEGLQRMAANKDQAKRYFIANGTLKGFEPGGTDIAMKQGLDEKARNVPRGSGMGIGTTAQASELTPNDAEAIHWAQRNLKDPRAQKILQLHGMK
jgi:hypothetical protein